jgi:hypothetical protein
MLPSSRAKYVRDDGVQGVQPESSESDDSIARRGGFDVGVGLCGMFDATEFCR